MHEAGADGPDQQMSALATQCEYDEQAPSLRSSATAKSAHISLPLPADQLLVRGRQEITESEAVIASDSEAIQTGPQQLTPSLDCFALLAMTGRAVIL